MLRRLIPFAVGLVALSLVVPPVSAASSKLQVVTTFEKGTYVSINLGKSQAKKSVIVEVGTKSKKTKVWKYSRLKKTKTSATGSVGVCSSRLLAKSSRLRVRVGSKIFATVTLSRAIQLSGCSYVPIDKEVVPVTVVPTTTIPTTTIPTTTIPTTTVPPTTTTVAPTTTTTVPSSTPAPTSLALTAASDTGDSDSDGITNATNIEVTGSAQIGSSVQVYLDGNPSGSPCITNGAGEFTCALSTVTEGNKSVTAKATGSGGESIASQPLTMVVDRTAPTVTWGTGNYWIGSNATLNIPITVSENTTTLTSTDLQLACSMVGGCALSNFAGSGRNYSVDFTTINNSANGGAVSIPVQRFADIAGNLNSTLSGASVMYDAYGPVPSFSRNGVIITITFDEPVFDFTESDLVIAVYTNGSLHSRYPAGNCTINLRNPLSDGKTWLTDLACDVDSLGPPTTYQLELSGSVADAEGNLSNFESWLIPRVDLGNA